jgi:hypothetical protein
VFAFLRRVIRGQHFALGDLDHLHHRLMRLGHGPRRAVAILWLWTLLLSAVVLLPAYTNRGNSLMPLGVFGLALLLYIYFHPGVRAARQDVPGVDAVPAIEAVPGVEPTPVAVGTATAAPAPVVELAPRRARRGA